VKPPEFPTGFLVSRLGSFALENAVILAALQSWFAFLKKIKLF